MEIHFFSGCVWTNIILLLDSVLAIVCMCMTGWIHQYVESTFPCPQFHPLLYKVKGRNCQFHFFLQLLVLYITWKFGKDTNVVVQKLLYLSNLSFFVLCFTLYETSSYRFHLSFIYTIQIGCKSLYYGI